MTHEKKSLEGIKTLAMLKMEKNFIAYCEKKYPRKPYNTNDWTIQFWIHRIEDELAELHDAYWSQNLDIMMEECADISNLVDYLFEKLTHYKILKQVDFQEIGEKK